MRFVDFQTIAVAIMFAAGLFSGCTRVVTLRGTFHEPPPMSPDAFRDEGRPLHRAARRGNMRKAEQLLERGADVDAKDEVGRTPLHQAAWHGRCDVAELLLEHGADANSRSDVHVLETPLHAAAAMGWVELAEALLDGGANVNSQDSRHGITPIYLATVADSEQLVAVLKAHGADESIEDEWGQTPVEAADVMRQRDTRELAAASDQPLFLDPRAIVRIAYLGVTMSERTYKGTRVAFAVGDGSIVVTAAHCVTDFIEDTQKGVLVKPLLISPYYGDVFEGEIIAVDEDADVAVIRAGWGSHPALELACNEELAETAEIVIAGYPPTEKRRRKIRINREVFMEQLPVLRLDVNAGHSAITLGGRRFVGPGWSGSAMLLPDSGKVAGVFGSRDSLECAETTFLYNLMGCAVNSIRSLLEENGIQPDNGTQSIRDDAPEDAKQALAAIIGYVEGVLNDDRRNTLSEAQELIRLRPESGQARLLLAWLADEAGELEEPSCRQAVRLAPDSVAAHAVYARFLHGEGRDEEAIAEFKRALELEQDNTFVLSSLAHVMTLVNVEEAEMYGRRLVDSTPDDAYAWYLFAGILERLHKYDEEIRAAQTAMDTDDESQPRYRRRLADAFRHAGRFEQAEHHYNKLFETHDCARCWFAYAQLLSNLGAERRADALRALDKTESINEENLVLPRSIRNLREKLKSGGKVVSTIGTQSYWFRARTADGRDGDKECPADSFDMRNSSMLGAPTTV